MSADSSQVIVATEHLRFGGESGAGMMRNRCAFTSRDMGADWPDAFTYAVVFGWDDAMADLAAQWGWDAALVEFLRDAHERFKQLPGRTAKAGGSGE